MSIIPHCNNYIAYRHVLDDYVAGYQMDRHWRPQHQICHPCHIRYSFIGHLETIDVDANAILRQIGVAEHVITFPSLRRPRTTTDFARRALVGVPAAGRKRLIDMYRPDYELFDFEIDDRLLVDETD